ncbi:DDE superfamily endonuclease domain [Cinara cedri]|uniref:DDE superfamily endonuclease domain n=1 Tax=Cinara cedri TaxID=506608 RepID=A0A5E4N4W1_9HEMI|nr:DDE superfamily endonuclease domain [Cinara cedri]
MGRILKNREDIECEALQNKFQRRKMKRCGKHNTIERALKNGNSWMVTSVEKKNISFQKTHREQGGADFASSHFWLENEWPSLISEYSPSDVFNADETSLYIRSLPEYTVTGEKKKLLVVGKSKQPRCFKGVKALPVDYSANKNAWMTQEIFSQWLIKSKIRTRIITLLDETLEYESTSTLKANDLAKKFNVLEALHLANEAWNNISDVTIRNCFRYGGFVKTEEEEDEEKVNDLQTSEEYSDDQICQSIANESTSISEEKNDESDGDEEEVKPPSNKEVLEALEVLKKAVFISEVIILIYNMSMNSIFLEY